MDNLEMLMNELESEILTAKKATFSSTDVIVNKMSLLSFISRMRTSYPAVLKEANQITKEKDEILKRAEEYANNVMDTAEAQANQAISESEIMAQAKKEAENIINEASENYSKLEYDARALAFNILDSAEKTMRDSLTLVNNKKQQLISN